MIQANEKKCSKTGNTLQGRPTHKHTTAKLRLEGALSFRAPTLALGLPPQPQLDQQKVKPIKKKKKRKEKQEKVIGFQPV